MRLNSPSRAIVWEIWHRNRTMLTTVLAATIFGAVLARLAGSDNSWTNSIEASAFTGLGIVLLLCFGSFHFTEGQKKGGFGSFPTRLFRLPISTAQLVALPMLTGSVLVAIVYLTVAVFVFRPLGRDLPILWPCLYLVFGLTQFQAIIWSLPERRYAKLLCLSLAATGILIGWMFFLPHIVAGTLSDWGYQGDPQAFLRMLLIALSLAGPAAYLVSLLTIGRQRHGTTIQLLPAIPRLRTGKVFSRTRPFRSATQAILWQEWRETGLILPCTVTVIIALMFIPTVLSESLGPRGTRAVVSGFILAPVLLALIIGRGFAKPNFWRPELTMTSFDASRPIASSTWVHAKLQVAAASVLLTWIITLSAGTYWFIYCGDFAAFSDFTETLRFYYTSAERVLIAILLPLCFLLLSWRFLIGGLPTGLSGRKSWFYLQNSLTAIFLISLLTYLIARDEPDPERHLQYYRFWPGVTRLPTFFAVAAIAKAGAAFLAWRAVAGRKLYSNKSILCYLVFWTAATAVPVSFVLLFWESPLWLKISFVLLALLSVPLAGPPLATLAMANNRSQR